MVDIRNCDECPKRYFNYLPDGKKPKEWCRQFDKEITDKKNSFPIFCTLPTVDNFEQQEPDDLGSTQDIYDLPGANNYTENGH